MTRKGTRRKRVVESVAEGFALISPIIAQRLRGLNVPGWADTIRDEGPQRRKRRRAFVPTVCAEIVHAWQTAKSGHRNAVPEMALISYETMLKLCVEAWKATQPDPIELWPIPQWVKQSIPLPQNFPRNLPPGRYSMTIDEVTGRFKIKP